ncbi:hypothetical protein M5689_021374 [Euphorbia peplus]|nr:hypothetical protein M5689_021374 [Euphorbia peplus]
MVLLATPDTAEKPKYKLRVEAGKQHSVESLPLDITSETEQNTDASSSKYRNITRIQGPDESYYLHILNITRIQGPQESHEQIFANQETPGFRNISSVRWPGIIRFRIAILSSLGSLSENINFCSGPQLTTSNCNLK